MAEKVTYKVRLEGSDGKFYVMTYANLRQELGVYKLEEMFLSHARWSEHIKDTVFARINKLTQDLIDIETPKMKARILNLLRDHPHTKTRDITCKNQWTNRILWGAFAQAFKELHEEGGILPTSHGQGHDRTWTVWAGDK